jgi:hypothetical protein
MINIFHDFIDRRGMTREAVTHRAGKRQSLSSRANQWRSEERRERCTVAPSPATGGFASSRAAGTWFTSLTVMFTVCGRLDVSSSSTVRRLPSQHRGARVVHTPLLCSQRGGRLSQGRHPQDGAEADQERDHRVLLLHVGGSCTTPGLCRSVNAYLPSTSSSPRHRFLVC